MQRVNAALYRVGLKFRPQNYAKCINSVGGNNRDKGSPKTSTKICSSSKDSAAASCASKRHNHVHITRDFSNRGDVNSDRFLLSHDSIGLDELKTGKRTKLLVLIHGILGSKRNWRTVMKSFSVKDPQLAVLAVDLRGHGDSGLNYSLLPEGAPIHPSFHVNTVENCAYDLVHLLSQLDIPTTTNLRLCAHSFGGKVALKYLEICEGYRKTSDMLMSGVLKTPSPVSSDNDVTLTPSVRQFLQPSHTWIVDSVPSSHAHKLHYYGNNMSKSSADSVDAKEGPAAFTSANTTVDAVIHALLALPPVFPSKQYVIDHLTSPPNNISMEIAQWISTSIVSVPRTDPEEESAYRFMFNIHHIVELYIDYSKTNMFPFLQRYSSNTSHGKGDVKTKIHFICAGKNDAWTQPLPHGELEISTGSKVIANTPMEYLEAIKNESIAVWRMPNVGHWVHSEDPKGFISLVLDHSD